MKFLIDWCNYRQSIWNCEIHSVGWKWNNVHHNETEAICCHTRFLSITELVSQEPIFIWGSGLIKWMSHYKNADLCKGLNLEGLSPPPPFCLHPPPPHFLCLWVWQNTKWEAYSIYIHSNVCVCILVLHTHDLTDLLLMAVTTLDWSPKFIGWTPVFNLENAQYTCRLLLLLLFQWCLVSDLASVFFSVCCFQNNISISFYSKNKRY